MFYFNVTEFYLKSHILILDVIEDAKMFWKWFISHAIAT